MKDAYSKFYEFINYLAETGEEFMYDQLVTGLNENGFEFSARILDTKDEDILEYGSKDAKAGVVEGHDYIELTLFDETLYLIERDKYTKCTIVGKEEN